MADRAADGRLWSLFASIVAPIILPAMGCGGDGAMTGDAMAQCPEPNPGVDVDPARAERIQRLRDEITRTINESSCPGSGCDMVSFQPVPAAAAPASEGSRILLIEEAIATVSATRYQSRTLAYLTHDADGTYHPTEVTIQIARDALSIFQAADQFTGPLSSEEIDLVAPFGAKFGSVIPNWTGHGMDILPFLADRIPRAQFVVSESLLDDPLSDPQLCGVNDPGTRESALQRLEDQLANTTLSLSGVIQHYAINDIHLSWGTTRAEIEQFLQTRCGAVPRSDVIDRIQAG